MQLAVAPTANLNIENHDYDSKIVFFHKPSPFLICLDFYQFQSKSSTNLVFNCASQEKISFPSGLRSRQQYLWPKSSGSRAVGPHLAECNTQITQTSKLEIDDSTLRSEPRLQRSWLTARHWQLLQPRLGSSHTSVYLSHVSVISIMYKFLH